MKAVVFAGPTISPAEIRNLVDGVDVLGPARQGDVYRAALSHPDVIGLIDGYFDRVPSVWHKEILWAMREGIQVVGAASMGALRAAELAPFGMIGVGKVFRAFHLGELDRDDEVAIIHGPPESGYRSLSDAMVNIRASVSNAFLEGIISATTADLAIATGIAMNYADRTYPALLAHLRATEHDPDWVEDFARWLKKGAVNQKHLDALALCRLLALWQRTSVPVPTAGYVLGETDAWEHARRYAEHSGGQVQRNAGSEERDEVTVDSIIEELRVLGKYREVEESALARNLAARVSAGEHKEYVRLGRSVLSQRQGLETRRQLTAWLTEQGVRSAEREGFFRRSGQFARVRSLVAPSLEPYLLDHLRAEGNYADLVGRAERKAALVTTSSAAMGTRAANEKELWSWYRRSVLKGPHPSNLEDLARSLGFDNVRQMKRAVQREYNLAYAEGRLRVSQKAAGSIARRGGAAVRGRRERSKTYGSNGRGDGVTEPRLEVADVLEKSSSRSESSRLHHVPLAQASTHHPSRRSP